MPTITDTLLTLAQDFRDGVAAVRGVLSEVMAIKTGGITQITTIINNYQNRPPLLFVFVDPVDGSDANDGKSVDAPKRSIDNVIASMGSNATSILLLNDAIWRRRHSLYAPLSFTGIQRANTPTGYVIYKRKVSFVGTAENSPEPITGSFTSGLFTVGGSLRTVGIDFELPDVPAGLDFRSHITAGSVSSISLEAFTLIAGGAAAGFLFGVQSGRVIANLTLTLGSGAAGHLFQGVAGGQNPNNLWIYDSNVTAA